MKRYSKEHVALVTRAFAGSREAVAWTMFGPDIRNAIIDSLVIHQIRIADSVDSAITLTAAELMAFRNEIVDALAAGVRSRGTKVSYRVEE